MRFLLTDEQLALAEAIDDIVGAHGGPAVARAWAAGDTAPGRALWDQLAETGLMGLRIGESEGGFDGSASDTVVVFERLGWHGVPGPLLETIVLAPVLVDEQTRGAIASGEVIASATVEPGTPFALDADIATHLFVIADGAVSPARIDGSVRSLDAARRLFALIPEGEGHAVDEEALRRAVDETTLACASVLLGAGERLLTEAVSYAKIRHQFGRPIGEYQAVKHQLADVRVALSFARPLVQNAALTIDTPDRGRDVSVAKITASDAATAAARAALQVHGAVGYTAEADLGIWLTRVQALSAAWGGTDMHRERVAGAILAR
ncbi:acyl-CoA/acyl-ACP dehydrogenase [Microbacterium sp. CFH 31415]|uniref:acyl-CoA dehydrogenase family protein n=1 Tax=Microbacterium sp. CFH 31415 TaxID=2921732 RepID=UPI001F1460D4|nr:acyl-CoA dehydrogenase family protein [Microbacterium sp. CFH 31415]MCH6231602.1 acyl-CoA/acyl-ACP dehydrogenase [Microbacterium sp. CFH 31415]